MPLPSLPTFASTGRLWPYPRYDSIFPRNTMDETTRADLDETRRLLYMVLLGGLQGERWWNLAGTLTNALAHHSQLVTAHEALTTLAAIREDGLDEHRPWVEALIARVTALLAG